MLTRQEIKFIKDPHTSQAILAARLKKGIPSEE
jgi:hypothetical protein